MLPWFTVFQPSIWTIDLYFSFSFLHLQLTSVKSPISHLICQSLSCARVQRLVSSAPLPIHISDWWCSQRWCDLLRAHVTYTLLIIWLSGLKYFSCNLSMYYITGTCQYEVWKLCWTSKQEVSQSMFTAYLGVTQMLLLPLFYFLFIKNHWGNNISRKLLVWFGIAWKECK